MNNTIENAKIWLKKMLNQPYYANSEIQNVEVLDENTYSFKIYFEWELTSKIKGIVTNFIVTYNQNKQQFESSDIY